MNNRFINASHHTSVCVNSLSERRERKRSWYWCINTVEKKEYWNHFRYFSIEKSVFLTTLRTWLIGITNESSSYTSYFLWPLQLSELFFTAAPLRTCFTCDNILLFFMQLNEDGKKREFVQFIHFFRQEKSWQHKNKYLGSQTVCKHEIWDARCLVCWIPFFYLSILSISTGDQRTPATLYKHTSADKQSTEEHR